MKYYHLTLVCFNRNRDTLNAAFKKAEPDNVLSENWNQFNTECVVKAPDVTCVGPGVLAIYDSSPYALVTHELWTGNVGE